MVFLLAAANLVSGCKSHPEQKKVYAHEGRDPEEAWPENNSGPDAPAPYRAGKPKESEQSVSANSTPTPTPNRPIDRPLDPTGLPMSAPTP